MMPWKAKQLTHEGFPLLLRYPENLDVSSSRMKFPNLVVFPHQFSKVTPNGLPEADYNDSLTNFDTDIRKAFEAIGIVVLIETFGGRRNYYSYVSPEADTASTVAKLTLNHPQEKLTWSIRPDSEWNFIQKYAQEFTIFVVRGNSGNQSCLNS